MCGFLIFRKIFWLPSTSSVKLLQQLYTYFLEIGLMRLG